MNRLLTIGGLLLATCVSFAAPSSVLSKIDRSRLLATKMHAAIPTYLPAGYKQTSLQLDKTEGKFDSYELVWEKGLNGKLGTIIVEMASEGIGDVLFTVKGDTFEPTSRKATTSLGKKVDVEFLDNKTQHQFHTNWIDLGEKHFPRFVAIIGGSVSHADAVRIVHTLTFLKR